MTRTRDTGGRDKRAAFTLIELLVVIAIIALLVALLVPMLTMAKELARRSACASNVHNWGAICQVFANDHNDLFPRGFSANNDTHAWMLRCNSRDLGPGKRHQTWLTGGTPFHSNGGPYDADSWENYGLSKGLVQCPSAHDFWAGNGGVWGPDNWAYDMHYVYVGGYNEMIGGTSRANWQALPPADSATEDGLSSKILICDRVYYGGGPGWGYRNGYSFGHPRAGERNFMGQNPGWWPAVGGDPSGSYLPAWQNLYFADGHTEGKGEEYYRDDLTSGGGGNWGACAYPYPAWGGPFFYWEGTPRR